MKVAFIHPDLGIGGAERLVVDCALAMKELGHEVVIYTSHHDPRHCFDETRDGTLQVKVLGNTVFPRTVNGRLAILCAILRQLHLTRQLIAAGPSAAPDLFIVDQLSACVPELRIAFPHARVLFYCHHPDLLLTERKTLLKTLYRLPFDAFEKWTTSLSDTVVVNSEYTRQVYLRTFGHRMPTPAVVYPVVDPTVPEIPVPPTQVLDEFEGRILLSINRFERKKNIELALEAYALLLHALPVSQSHLLVLAGGYDERVPENIEYLAWLRQLAATFRLPTATVFPGEDIDKVDLNSVRVLFLPSIKTSLKNWLLKRSAALLYTPTNEHFGIVPLEAMRAATPVLATNTGGPLETVHDGVTGWLREPDVDQWMHVLKYVLVDASPAALAEMGRQGQTEVAKAFSPAQLQKTLAKTSHETIAVSRANESTVVRNIWLVKGLILSVFLLGPVAAFYAVVYLIGFVAWLWPILVESTQW